MLYLKKFLIFLIFFLFSFSLYSADILDKKYVINYDLEYEGYVLNYNQETRQPNFVAYYFTNEEAKNLEQERNDRFRQDKRIKNPVKSNDYTRICKNNHSSSDYDMNCK